MNMEDLRLWIKDVGFPIVCACAAMYACYRLFLMRERDRDARNDKVAMELKENTGATRDLTISLRGWGSDPFKKVCRAQELADAINRDTIAREAAAARQVIARDAELAKAVVDTAKPKPA
jgi:hypothetical protein